MTNILFSPAQALRGVFFGRHAASVRSLFLFLLCLAAAAFPMSPARAYAQDNNILLIFSEQTPSEIRMDMGEAFFKYLIERGKEFDCEQIELDSLHDQNIDRWVEKLDEKKESIKAGKYKLIIAFGEPAANTLRTIRPEVPQETFIILSCMKSFSHDDWCGEHPNTTAVIRGNDPRQNIEFGMKLFPERTHVILLVSRFGWPREQDELLRKEYAGKCTFSTIYVNSNSYQNMNDACEKIAAAPDNSFIVSCDWDIYLPNTSSRTNMWRQLLGARSSDEQLPLLVRRPPDDFLRKYALGGYISPLQAVGRQTADLAEKILDGKGAPEKTVPETCTVYYNQINKWDYVKEAIPSDAVWIDLPEPWIQKYERAILTASIIGVVLCAFLLGGLLYFIKYRRVTSRYLAIHGHMPLLVAVYSTSGEVLYSHVPFNDPDASQNLDDLRVSLTNSIRIEMAETAISGKTMTVNRKHADKNYTVTLTKLNKKVFNHEAVLVVAQDTTEMAELREKAASIATRLQHTLRAIGDGVIVTDRLGFVTMLNRSAEKMTGFTQTEAEGKTIQDVFQLGSPDGSSNVISPIDTAIRENRVVTNSEILVITAKDGAKRRISTSTSPIRGAKNTLLGAIVVFRDVTEDFERREEIAAKTHALQSATALASLGYFYYTPETDTFEAPSPAEALWPFDNGKRVQAEDWFCKEDLPDYLAQRRALFNGKTDTLECTFRSDFFGDSRHFRITAVRDTSARRKKTRFFFMIQDITKVRDLETKAANALLFLKALFDLMPCTATVRDYNNDCRLVMANKKYCYQLNTTEEKIIGTNYSELFDPSLAKMFREMDDEVARSFGEVVTHVVNVPTHDGNGVAQISHIAFKDNTGRLLIFGCSIDVTELHDAIKAAESAAKAKSLFLATMSHEIRTPLNAILGFSRLLQDESLPPAEAAEYLRSIHYAGNALLSLINDILDLSKLDADQMLIQPEPTDLRELLFELEAVFTAKAKSQGIELVTSVPDDLPILNLDERRLRQVLLNIIGNAVKFTQQGSVTVSLAFFKLNDKRAALTIRVADTGCGISKESLSKIFDPFVQDKSSYRGIRTENGTGLGLSIAKRLIDCMKGSLTVESTVGKGSVFTVLLPEIEMCANANLRRETASAAGALDVSKKILVVDDVALNVKVLCAMLRKLGFSPVSAPSGAKALELMKTTKPDIALLDLWMPEMNGMELASAIRENPDWKDVRIVAVTADTENASNFKVSLFDDVIMKPVTNESLRKVLA